MREFFEEILDETRKVLAVPLLDERLSYRQSIGAVVEVHDFGAAGKTMDQQEGRPGFTGLLFEIMDVDVDALDGEGDETAVGISHISGRAGIQGLHRHQERADEDQSDKDGSDNEGDLD